MSGTLQLFMDKLNKTQKKHLYFILGDGIEKKFTETKLKQMIWHYALHPNFIEEDYKKLKGEN